MSYVAGTGFIFNDANGGGVSFNQGASNKVRISSAGHTTFGTTNLTPADSAVNGSSILSDGRINHNAQSQPAAVIGRTGTNGAIVDFRKNGATVGSIGTASVTTYYAGLYVGLNMNYYNAANSTINPVTPSGVNRDGVDDLGFSASRFRDLYLSGGVYLGGTGAANKLDDYEEGTWTPAVSSGTVSVGHATYTKIGNRVYITMEVTLSGTRSATGSFAISGLPFTIGDWTSSVCYAQNYNYEGTKQLAAAYQASSSQIVFIADGEQEVGTDFSNGYLNVSGFYRTTS